MVSPERQIRFWFVGLIVLIAVLFVLRAVLLPFVAGMAIAYLFDPVVDRLERIKIPRGVASLVVIGGALVVFGVALVLLLPLLQSQLSEFAQNVPVYAAALRDLGEQLVSAAAAVLSPADEARLRAEVGAQLGNILSGAGGMLEQALVRGLALANLLSLIFITPIVAFYLLRDWDRMVAHLSGLLPRRHAEEIKAQLAAMDRKLAGVVRGQATVSAILGVYYAAGLSLAGLQFGLVVGLGAGVVSFIPYVGSISGFVVSVGLAVLQFDSWPPVAIVAGIFLVGQAVEGNFLTPKLVGGQVGLHPVWVIFALLAGGSLLGLLGLLLALPAAAVISVVVAFGIGQYQKSLLFLDPSAPVTGGDDPPAQG